MFGERQLRLGVDGVGQLDQVAATTPHRVFDAVRVDWRQAYSQYLTEAAATPGGYASPAMNPAAWPG